MCSIGCPNPRSVPSDSNATTSARRTFGSPVASATTRVYEPDAVASMLAAADVFTESTTFWVMESIRLDLGYASQVHP